MRKGQASRTAQRVATHRAAHQLLDDPKVLDDPLALALLGPDAAAALEADPQSANATPISPRLRAFTAARSRFAEDELAASLGSGVGQYVLLGAGLDTFAYRNPHPPAALRVFEVDHPATQAWKRGRLAGAKIAAPPELSYAPLDFHEQTLGEGLAGAGWDPAVPSLFAWLGVTPYLSGQAVQDTLGFIAACPAGSGVVLDYAVSPELLDQRGRTVFDILSGWSADAGEPWLSTFDPLALGRQLRALGFGRVDDLSPEEINARYFAGRSDGLAVGSLYRLLSARV
ncbi:MAG: SAM-dependent methyltransferase [Desulfarculaceae bacterium]|nr:SAM-dependent methyltransferase [Desulfarculaceae bacterium]MCF8073686.1 SAM-dependent methyltransferase [Desulfarculaceae bacterium]MCF8101927.1 SAM-dependent methyltransferase [Desulfarculaceae bacterium]MCF8117650.1 SAM-dependent methyltransferase [Desulfarculaceae bacterium]